ncbi:MAG: alpha/beta hydrolase [Caldisericia bacterium]|nr:alpha/beta hydrolase [Caldisericia bacterium]
MGYVKVNDLNLYYEIYGEGEPLVFIEGLAQNILMWKYQIEELKNHFKIVVFDLRGNGKSDKPISGYSVDTFADDTISLIRELKLEKPNILGVSLGGFVALKVLYKYGKEINKGVLVNTSFGGPNYIPPSMEVLNIMITGGGGKTPFEKGFNSLSLGFTDKFIKEKRGVIEEIVKSLLENPQPPYAYQGQAMAGASFNMEKEVEEIENEVLVVIGEKDKIVPKQNGLNLKNKLKNSKLHIIKDAGHLCFIEKYEEFNEVVKNFLLGR